MGFLFLGLAIGGIIAYFLYERFARKNEKSHTSAQSMVLMERIRAVCKLITVEGDFAEIYHYESLKTKWMDKLKGTKKAIVLIDAKAHIGFDLTQVKMEADDHNKTIRLYAFPEPKIISIDTDFRYYDKKKGWANPFTSTDLTEINSEAKQHIIDKVPESGLYQEARKQALVTTHLMEKVVETIGWKLDYSGLQMNNKEQPKIHS